MSEQTNNQSETLIKEITKKAFDVLLNDGLIKEDYKFCEEVVNCGLRYLASKRGYNRKE